MLQDLCWEIASTDGKAEESGKEEDGGAAFARRTSERQKQTARPFSARQSRAASSRITATSSNGTPCPTHLAIWASFPSHICTDEFDSTSLREGQFRKSYTISVVLGPVPPQDSSASLGRGRPHSAPLRQGPWRNQFPKIWRKFQSPYPIESNSKSGQGTYKWLLPSF